MATASIWWPETIKQKTETIFRDFGPAHRDFHLEAPMPSPGRLPVRELRTFLMLIYLYKRMEISSRGSKIKECNDHGFDNCGNK